LVSKTTRNYWAEGLREITAQLESSLPVIYTRAMKPFVSG